MTKKVIYIHGKGGNAAESEHYKKFFPNCEVVGFDYKYDKPYENKIEFQNFFDLHDPKFIIANSIGAFFTMNALFDRKFDAAFFISPIVDMEEIILNMMKWSNVTEENLCESQEIVTESGEILSWKYLCYVRENHINWKVPTHILYGEKDFLTSLETIKNFAEKIGATLTVMKGGKHWFHTSEQMNFLDNWLEEILL
jgi:hypothetical protein